MEQERIIIHDSQISSALHEVQQQIGFVTNADAEKLEKAHLDALVAELEHLKKVVTDFYQDLPASSGITGVMKKMMRFFATEQQPLMYSLTDILKAIQEAQDSINIRTESGFNKKRLEAAETILNHFAGEVRLMESGKKQH